MADIFISYASEDRETMLKLRSYLESLGFSCWSAPDNIKGGETWTEQILKAINECKAICIIFSRDANASDHVKTELTQSFDKGKPIIPIRIQDVQPTGTLEYILKLKQWIDAFPGPIDRHYVRLRESISEFVQQAESTKKALGTEQIEQDETKRAAKQKNRILIASAASLAVLLTITLGISLAAYLGTEKSRSADSTTETSVENQDAPSTLSSTEVTNQGATSVIATISITPNPVIAWEMVTITYSITNNSSRAITKDNDSLSVQVGLGGLNSSTLLADISQDIDVGATVQGNITAEMQESVPGDYKLMLSIGRRERPGSNVLLDFRTLAETPVTVNEYLY